MDVGIRELKARLSHYVKAARGGDRVVITERGKPVAILVSANSEFAPNLPPRLQALVEEGRLTPATRPSHWPRIAVAKATQSLDEILEDDRGDD